MRRTLQRLRSWAFALKVEIIALWLAARDSRTPVAARLVAGAVAAFALSPIDLIPDFIPILGYLDDLIILPLGIALALRLTPVPLMDEFRAVARASAIRPSSFAGAVIIVLLWLAMLAMSALWLGRFTR